MELSKGGVRRFLDPIEPERAHIVRAGCPLGPKNHGPALPTRSGQGHLYDSQGVTACD